MENASSCLSGSIAGTQLVYVRFDPNAQLQETIHLFDLDSAAFSDRPPINLSPFPQALTGLQSGKPIASSEIEPDLPIGEYSELIEALGVSSLVYAPIQGYRNGQYFLGFERNPTFEQWTLDEAVLLIHCSELLANAIQKAEAQNESPPLIQAIQRRCVINNLSRHAFHEANNALQPVVGFSSILLREAPSNSKERDHYSYIFNGSKRFASLIGSLIDLNQDADIPDVIQSIDLSAELGKLILTVNQLTSKQIDFHFEEPKIHPYVNGSLVQLRQAMLNLLYLSSQYDPENRIQLRISLGTPLGDPPPNKRPIDLTHFVKISIALPANTFKSNCLHQYFDRDAASEAKPPSDEIDFGIRLTQEIIASHKGWINLKQSSSNQASLAIYLPTVTDTPLNHEETDPS